MTGAARSRASAAELLRFLIVGGAVVIVDFAVYFGLLWLMPTLGLSLAKALAFVAGATTSFLLNRSFVFRSVDRAQRQLLSFVFLYGLGLGLNTTANALSLRAGAPKLLAWLIATGASTISNFLGMKLFVFRRKPL